MFCSKCGTEIADGATFCHKCGTQAQPAGSVPQTPGMAQTAPLDKVGEKKSGKWPLFLGIGILAVIIIVVVIAIMGASNGGAENPSSKRNGSSKTTEDSSSGKEVSLSETYTNETEGFSFQYPSGWEIADVTDYYDDYGIIGKTVVLLANEEDELIGSLIHILKYPASQEDIDYFVYDEAFVEEFETSNDVSVVKTSATEIDGVDARMISYVDHKELFSRCYYYGMGSALYRIEFRCHNSQNGSFERFFDAIMGSYTITAIVSTEPDIYFNGIPLTELMELISVELVQEFGLPDYTDGNGRLSYEKMDFYIWDDESINNIITYYPECLSIGGQTLKFDSDGTVSSESVIELFGSDYVDEWPPTGYYMTYTYPTYTISFSINIYNEVCDIVIHNLLSGGSAFPDYTFDESPTGFNEPIEAYYKLSGSYAGIRDGSAASVSIYSSQSEGETAIGNIEICAAGEYYYYGEITVQAEGVYKIATTTGEEVLLAEIVIDDTIVLNLYVDGENIDSYWMIEHYVS